MAVYRSAFATFAKRMFDNGVPWIDCQVYTDHLARFGAREIPRAEYLQMLSAALDCQDDGSNGINLFERGSTKTATVIYALEQLVRFTKLTKLRTMRGAMPDFDLNLDVLRGRV